MEHHIVQAKTANIYATSNIATTTVLKHMFKTHVCIHFEAEETLLASRRGAGHV